MTTEEGWTNESTTGHTFSAAEGATPSSDQPRSSGSVCKYLPYEIFFYCGVLGFLYGFGMIGNLLSVFTMWPKRHTNATSFILIVLAFVDSVYLSVSFTQLTIPTYCAYYKSCEYYMAYTFIYLRQYLWPIGTTAQISGALVVTLVTFHRYLAVCHPLKVVKWGSAKMAKIQIAAIVSGTIVFVFPMFIDDYVVVTEAGAKLLPAQMKQDLLGYGMMYNVVIYYLVIFVAPCSLLIFFTYNLIVSLRVAKEKREQMTKSKRDEDDLTQTLVVVVVVFIICQIANPIRRLIVELTRATYRQCGSVYYFYTPIASVLIAGNCAINFVIYLLCGRRFRQTLKRRLMWLFSRGNNQIDPNTSVSLDAKKPEENPPSSRKKRDDA